MVHTGRGATGVGSACRRGMSSAAGTGNDVCSAATVTEQEEMFVLRRDLPCYCLLQPCVHAKVTT